MAIYMNYDSLKIKGDATQGNHADWIGISTFQFGIGRSVNTPTGNAQNRETSEPIVSEVMVTKGLDSASTMLFQTACTSKEGKTITFDFCRSDDKGDAYLTIELSDAVISSFTTESSGDKPKEYLTLNFTKIDLKETTGNSKNGNNQPVKVCYDMATASKS